MLEPVLLLRSRRPSFSPILTMEESDGCKFGKSLALYVHCKYNDQLPSNRSLYCSHAGVQSITPGTGALLNDVSKIFD